MKFRGDQEALFELARRSGFSQQDLASHCAIARQNMNRYAKGRRELPEIMFCEILDLLDQNTKNPRLPLVVEMGLAVASDA